MQRLFGIVIAVFLVAGMATAARSQASAAQPNQPTITLAQLEQMALTNNPTLAEAAALVREAAGRKQQSGLYPNPTVGYTGAQIRGGSFRGGEQGFFVQQEIVLGGKLGLNRRIYQQEENQAQVEAQEQRQRVLSNVRLAYVAALAAQRTLELRRELSQLANQAVAVSHQLANVGEADAPDVLESEVEAQQADLDVTAAQQDLDRVWRQLAATVGKPDLPVERVAGDLEQAPAVNPEELVEETVRDSPAVRIAELDVQRAQAVLARARREPIPDLELRAGLQQNRELSELSNRPVGLEGFAEVGVQMPLFNRNQGNVAAARADLDRAHQEVTRVQLALRERAADYVQGYETSRDAVNRYKNQMIPRAQQAYQMYLMRYRQMAAAYPQVLIAQRTLVRLQVGYVAALESMRTSALVLQNYLLTDGLEAPSRPGEMNRTVREIDLPTSINTMNTYPGK
jgi:outer membrane protein, heavy metal efflux system